MLPSPVTSTPFSVKDILKLEQQHALNPHALMGVEQDSLQLQCIQSTLSRSLDLLYSPENHRTGTGADAGTGAGTGDQLNSHEFDTLRSSCGSPTEEDMDPAEDTSRIFIASMI